jgi:phosphoglycolate phosphatase
MPTVVFDLDGTLVDTAPDLVDSLNATLARIDVPPVAYAQARALIGGGMKPMLERALRAHGGTLATVDVDRLFDDFLVHYAAHIAERSRPFPGLVAALDRLREFNCQLAVCTNKFEYLSRRLLENLGLSARFAAICGQDTFGVKKPDPRMLQQTLMMAGGSPERAVLVGDSVTDIETGRATGVPVIAVDFGYSESPVASFDPDRVISDFGRLPAIAAELLGL